MNLVYCYEQGVVFISSVVGNRHYLLSSAFIVCSVQTCNAGSVYKLANVQQTTC